MTFPSLRLEGAILSPELFARADDLAGQRPADFGLPAGAVVKDEIARAWADAQDYWRIFQRKLDALQTNASATTETRNLWIVPLLGLLGYQLEYQPKAVEVHGKLYPISHRATNRGNLPVHVVSVRDPAGLDRRPERTNGPRMSAHGLVQEYLNLDEQLYGLVTNGRLLRLLRDSSRLVKLTYLEFDLDRIFTDGLYADFALLYRFLHASRLPVSSEGNAESLIERYHLDSVEAGARIRDGLSFAVEKTLQDLANGFLAHSRNGALRAAIESGQLTAPTYYQHILRLIYRLLFLFVIEERDLVYPKNARAKRDLYYRHYSLQRLRGLSKNRYLFDSRHDDAWFATLACFSLFEAGETGAKLGIAPLAGRLFHPEAIGPLRESHLDNSTLLAAFDELCSFEHPDTHQRVGVNYGALATEEFGSVYERLLELHPVFLIDSPTPRFTFKQAAGNERKTTGSYYTPSSLVECLLDSALEPVVSERLAGKIGEAAQQALLSIRVCDPACGSGHFLIAAGNRLARHLAILRSGAEEPSPTDRRHALRDVIGHCLYGVDINPMSVELCKVTLWIEATEPGKPLSFLDHHIQCGNSLLGVTPRLLKEGLPDNAFKSIAGDNKTVCTEAKKRNKEERRQLALFHGTDTAPWQRLGALPAAMLEVDSIRDDTAAGLQAKEERYAALVRSSGYLHSRFLADAWCATFVWKKTNAFPYPITNGVLRKIEHNPHDCPSWMRDEIQRLCDQYQFFHWHLAFPEVFSLPGKGELPENQHTGWNAGFDVMLGNPPWERVKLQEKEWFAERRPEIAEAPNAAVRKRLIENLAVESPALYAAFGDAMRQAEGESHILRDSGLFPLCARGDVNLYAVFAEAIRQHLAPTGRMGAVLPSGIATDDTTKDFFRDLVEKGSLQSLFDFQTGPGLFGDIGHARFKFCLFTVLGTAASKVIEPVFAFYLRDAAHASDPAMRFTLSAADIELLNPNSRTCPIFRSRKDAEITRAIYRRVPVLLREGNADGNAWRVRLSRMFDMSNASHLFRTRDQLRDEGWILRGNVFSKDGREYLPLYEAKMMHQFEHRFGDYATKPEDSESTALPDVPQSDLATPDFAISPRYWLPGSEIRETTSGREARHWFPCYRRIARAGDVRTMISAVLPFAGVADKAPVILTPEPAANVACLVASLNSFACDYAVRQKVGGTQLDYHYVYQFPVLPPATYAEPCAWLGNTTNPLRDWLLPRVLELTYTAWDLAPFAQDCGCNLPPFVWVEARRFQLRCELDAAYFHLYGLSRDDTAYILDTFPIVRRKDEAAHGTYRTKDTILALYDQLAEAQRTRLPFVSPLDPPPGNIRACHPPRTQETRPVPLPSPQPTVAIKEKAKALKPATLQPDELNLGLDLFGSVTTPSPVVSVRVWSDDVFRLPTGPRHGALANNIYVRQWLHAVLTLQPEGQTGIELFNAFRLLLTLESRKLIATSGDSEGKKWSRAFKQPVALLDFFAEFRHLVRSQEIECHPINGQVVFRRSAHWQASPSDWVLTDAEITLRALIDKALNDQLLPFIEPMPQINTWVQELENSVA